MAKIRIAETASTNIPTPPAGKASIFLDSADNIIKARRDDGSLIVLGVDLEFIQDAVGSLFTDSSTIDFTYNDAGDVASMEVIATAIDHQMLSGAGSNTHAQIDSHIANVSNPHNVTATQIGLGNVDNTSDSDKPVSSATQTALDLKYDANNPNGYETPAQLDSRDTSNRDRSNHTGSQPASTISDFDAEVSNNADVTTNSSKVSFPEAPIDGQQYARQSGSWSVVVGGGGGGETNTASNVGTAGVGVFKQKIGTNLEFKNIKSESNVITVTDDIIEDEIDISFAPGNVNTSALNNDANFQSDTQVSASISAHEGQADPHPDYALEASLSNVSTSGNHSDLTLDDGTNPHGTTKADIGLGNVPNIDATDRTNHTGTQLASTISDFAASVSASETVTSLSLNANILRFTDENGVNTDLDLSIYIDDTNLSRIVSGTLDSGTGIATFTRDDSSTFTVDFSSLNDQAAISTAISNHEAAADPHPQYETPTEVQAKIDLHANRTDNPHSVTKAQVGLGNADNTSDINKPISTLQQTALDTKANSTDVYTKTELDTGQLDNRYFTETEITAQQTSQDLNIAQNTNDISNEATTRANEDASLQLQITGNDNDISNIQSEQATQDSAITLNTAKVSFPEAPNDGFEYVRKNEAWVQNTGGGGGEINTASNTGTSGVGVFKQKTGADLEFKQVDSGSSKVSVVDNLLSGTVEIDVVSANINTSEINNDSNFQNNTQVQATVDAHANRVDNPHSVTKSQVGLGNVDNTSDLNKPISTTTQSALDLKYDSSNPNGYETPAQLDSRDINNRNRANHTGTQLASTISDFSSAVNSAETVTSLSVDSSGTLLTFNDENGTSNQIQTNVFGTEFEDFTDTNNITVTTGTKILTYNFPVSSKPAGRYRIQLSVQLEHSSTSNNDLLDLRVDGVQIGLEYEFEGKDIQSDIRNLIVLNGYYQHNSTGTFNIQLFSSRESGTQVLHGATAEVWRVS